MDYGRKDFFVAADLGFRDSVTDGWFDGWKANVAYNHAPFIKRVEEGSKFNDVDRDPLFTKEHFIERMKGLPESHREFASTYARAKNDDHFDFLFDAVGEELDYKQRAANAPFTAQLAGGITDVVNLGFFIPAFGQVRAAKTGTDAIKTGMKYGLGAGLVSEARRAPFAYADSEWESTSNVAMTTIFSGAFAGTGHYFKPFIKSSARKVIDAANGRGFKHVYDDDGNINLSGEKPYTEQSGGDFDAVTGNMLGAPTAKGLSKDNLPQSVKRKFYQLTNNAALSVEGNRSGSVAEQSVQMAIAPYLGKHISFMKTLRDLHHKEIMAMDDVEAPSFMGAYSPFTKDFDEWLENTFDRMIMSKSDNPEHLRIAKEGMTPRQADAVVQLEQMFAEFNDDAIYHNVFRRNDQLQEQIDELQKQLDDKVKLATDIEAQANKGAKVGISQKQMNLLRKLDGDQSSIRDEIERLQFIMSQPMRKDYFPINWDKKMLLADEGARGRLIMKLEKQYEKDRALNPDKDYKTSAFEDAERSLARILQEDADDFENIQLDFAGSSKHLFNRKTNIPAHEVSEFIIKNENTLYSYIERMGKKIAFHKTYGGKNIDEVLQEIETELRKQGGFTEAEIARFKADFYGDYERVMGSVSRRPDALDNQVIKAAKAWTGWTFLGGAGISAITDIGSIVMAHGIRDVMVAAARSASDRGFSAKAFKNLNAAGEGFELARNFQARELLSDNIKRVQPNTLEKTVAMGNKVYYTANFLGPITTYGKFLDTYIVQDKFIRIAQKMAKGNVNKRDAEFMARYGINQEMAEYIAKMPVERSASGKVMLSNTDAWPTSTVQERDALRTYQAALSAHADNTIIMATTFDKPQIVDGLLYMKDNAFFQQARKLWPESFKIEDRVSTAGQKMVRMDSQTLTLPFTFMNFAFGANNKIVNVIRDPNRQYRLQGVMSLLALSYLSLEYKDKAWWRGAGSIETLARVVDHSGLVGIYGDVGYMGLSMAVNSGLIDKDSSPIPPKYIDPDINARPMDALLEPFGATVGLARDTAKVVGNFMSGNYAEAHKDAFYVMPFVSLPYITDDARDLWNVGR